MDMVGSIILGLAVMAGVLLGGASLSVGAGWAIGQGIRRLARWLRSSPLEPPRPVAIYLGRPPLPGDEIYFDT